MNGGSSTLARIELPDGVPANSRFPGALLARVAICHLFEGEQIMALFAPSDAGYRYGNFVVREAGDGHLQALMLEIEGGLLELLQPHQCCARFVAGTRTCGLR